MAELRIVLPHPANPWSHRNFACVFQCRKMLLCKNQSTVPLCGFSIALEKSVDGSVGASHRLRSRDRLISRIRWTAVLVSAAVFCVTDKLSRTTWKISVEVQDTRVNADHRALTALHHSNRRNLAILNNLIRDGWCLFFGRLLESGCLPTFL